MKKKGKQIELSDEEIEALFQRLQEKSLLDKDYEDLQGMLEIIVTLHDAIHRKDVSIKRLLKVIFGIKSEKRDKLFENTGESPDSPLSEDGPALDDASTSTDKNAFEDTGNDEKQLTDKSRKGHGRNGTDAFTGAERKQVENNNLQAGQRCPFNCPTGRLYPLKPSLTLCFSGSAPVTATVFEAERLRCSACGAVFTAKIEDGTVSSGSRHYEASAKAAIPVYKYGFGMPFYRISKLQELVGIPLAPSTLWDKTEELANITFPVYQELIRQAAQAKLFHNDDTGMTVLSLMKENEEKEAKERTGMFTTGIVAILDDDTPIALFFTGRNHAGENLNELQKLRDPETGIPIQMCDALNRNTSDIFARYVAHCLSHGRRRFVDIIPIFPDECKTVIDSLAKIYKHDAFAKEKKMSDEKRLAYHQEHSGPVMQCLHDWMTKQIDEKKVEPNSVLGNAISYMLKHWPALTLFLTVAGAPLDNNICEQALKRIVLNRKNAMFYKNEVGAWIGDLFMSIIHTCSMIKVNPMDYLIKLQEYEAHIKTAPEKWMPWNYQDTVAKITEEPISI